MAKILENAVEQHEHDMLKAEFTSLKGALQGALQKIEAAAEEMEAVKAEVSNFHKDVEGIGWRLNRVEIDLSNAFNEIRATVISKVKGFFSSLVE